MQTYSDGGKVRPVVKLETQPRCFEQRLRTLSPTELNTVVLNTSLKSLDRGPLRRDRRATHAQRH